MSSVSNAIVIADLFNDIVESIRATGTIDSLAVSGDITTITSVNSLIQGEAVQLDGVTYVVLSASSTEYTIRATVITANSWNSLAPFYEHGHPDEIARVLSEKDNSSKYKFQKFPLIVLYQDFEEDRSELGVYCKCSLNFAIINITKETNRTPQRYTDNFVPILYPIYNDFLKAINNSRSFISKKGIFHTKTDRLLWGRSNQNILNTAIDAIEITKMDLTVARVNC